MIFGRIRRSGTEALNRHSGDETYRPLHEINAGNCRSLTLLSSAACILRMHRRDLDAPEKSGSGKLRSYHALRVESSGKAAVPQRQNQKSQNSSWRRGAILWIVDSYSGRTAIRMPALRCRFDHRDSHAVTERGKDADEQVRRHMLQVAIEDGRYPRPRCPGTCCDLRMGVLLFARDLFQASGQIVLYLLLLSIRG